MCNLFNKKVIIDIPKNHFQIIYITIHDHLALCYLIIQVCEVPALKIEYLLALDLCIGPLLCACSMQMVTLEISTNQYMIAILPVANYMRQPTKTVLLRRYIG
jgi:hypothetical protein